MTKAHRKRTAESVDTTLGHQDEHTCASCVLVRSRGVQHGIPAAATDWYEDDEVLVSLHPELTSALVVPRRHVGNLADLPPAALGRVLAALRRASLWMQERWEAPGTKVEETRASPASESHICFLIMSTGASPGEKDH